MLESSRVVDYFYNGTASRGRLLNGLSGHVEEVNERCSSFSAFYAPQHIQSHSPADVEPSARNRCIIGSGCGCGQKEIQQPQQQQTWPSPPHCGRKLCAWHNHTNTHQNDNIATAHVRCEKKMCVAQHRNCGSVIVGRCDAMHWPECYLCDCV